MPTNLKKVRIFVASPGDVNSERNQLFKVVNELNLTISALAPEKGIVLELIRWETHVHPGIGLDVQKVVGSQIDDYEIFIGIMWKRMGTPTTTNQSGTEEEFYTAYSKWQNDKTLPVLFYFCQEHFGVPQGTEDVLQLGKVVAFKEKLATKGLLVADYENHESFADVVRPHLLLVLGRMFSTKHSAMEVAKLSGANTGIAEISAIRFQILQAAKEYDETRNRMASGDARTRAMSLIASKMRSLALPAYPLLPDLIKSEHPGDRLAAVSILESIPTPEYLPWLADRVATETPFLAYHSTVALREAARNLRVTHHNEVKSAVDQALRHLDTLDWRDPNQIRTLRIANIELGII